MRTWCLLWSLNILLHFGLYKLWLFFTTGKRATGKIDHTNMFSLNLWGNKTIRALLVQWGIYIYFVCVLRRCVHIKLYMLFNGFYFFCFVDLQMLIEIIVKWPTYLCHILALRNHLYTPNTFPLRYHSDRLDSFVGKE